jgi:hypothetical protein
MLLPEGAWRVGLYYLYRAVDKRAKRSSRTSLSHTSRRENGKNRGVDLAKGYHSGAHAVVAVSRGGENTQGEGGIVLAFFWSAKTVRRDQQ